MLYITCSLALARTRSLSLELARPVLQNHSVFTRFHSLPSCYSSNEAIYYICFTYLTRQRSRFVSTYQNMVQVSWCFTQVCLEVSTRKHPKWLNRTSDRESDADSESGSPVSYSSFRLTIGLSRLVSEMFARETQTDGQPDNTDHYYSCGGPANNSIWPPSAILYFWNELVCITSYLKGPCNVQKVHRIKWSELHR